MNVHLGIYLSGLFKDLYTSIFTGLPSVNFKPIPFLVQLYPFEGGPRRIDLFNVVSRKTSI